MNSKKYSLVLGLLLTFLAGRLYAVELFVSASISRVDLEIANVGFDPKLARASVGAFFWEGIGLELQGDVWSEADDLSGIGVSSEISTFQAAYLRLQSPSSETYRAYVNLGYSELRVLTYSSLLPTSVVEEELSSPAFVVGFQKSLDRLPSLAYSLSYEVMYEDDRVKMSAFNFGYSYRFGVKE